MYDQHTYYRPYCTLTLCTKHPFFSNPVTYKQKLSAMWLILYYMCVQRFHRGVGSKETSEWGGGPTNSGGVRPGGTLLLKFIHLGRPWSSAILELNVNTSLKSLIFGLKMLHKSRGTQPPIHEKWKGGRLPPLPLLLLPLCCGLDHYVLLWYTGYKMANLFKNEQKHCNTLKTFSQRNLSRTSWEMSIKPTGLILTSMYTDMCNIHTDIIVCIRRMLKLLLHQNLWIVAYFSKVTKF